MRSRSIWDKDEQKFVSPATFYAKRSTEARSDLPTPMVVRDIEPYQSMQTGEVITSRSKHRSHLKEHGLVEIGNEPVKRKAPFEPENVERDLKDSIDQIEQGYVPEPVETDPDVTRIYPQE